MFSMVTSGATFVQVVRNKRRDRPALLLSAFSPRQATVSSLGGAGSPAPAGKTLSIEPVIEAIKFVSAAKRVMVGSMAGGSAVRMKVNFRDLSNGEIVAAPVFYEDVTAWTGSGSFGVADNMMLVKLAEDATNYAAQNR